MQPSNRTHRPTASRSVHQAARRERLSKKIKKEKKKKEQTKNITYHPNSQTLRKNTKQKKELETSHPQPAGAQRWSVEARAPPSMVILEPYKRMFILETFRLTLTLYIECNVLQWVHT